MKLKFEEIEKEYIDGVDVNIDLGTFIDTWMSVKRMKGTRGDVGNKLGISVTMVQLIETKLRGLKVELPVLRVSC